MSKALIRFLSQGSAHLKGGVWRQVILGVLSKQANVRMHGPAIGGHMGGNKGNPQDQQSSLYEIALII